MDFPPLMTTPITLARLDGDCQGYAFVPGHIETGVLVRCPDGHHEHEVLSVVHTEVAENIRIVS